MFRAQSAADDAARAGDPGYPDLDGAEVGAIEAAIGALLVRVQTDSEVEPLHAPAEGVRDTA